MEGVVIATYFARPVLWLSTSSSVISRVYASSDITKSPGSRSHIFASYCTSGYFSSSLTRSATEAAVRDLEADAMSKSVSAVQGLGSGWRDANPYPAEAISSSCTIAMAMPGTCCFLMSSSAREENLGERKRSMVLAVVRLFGSRYLEVNAFFFFLEEEKRKG